MPADVSIDELQSLARAAASARGAAFFAAIVRFVARALGADKTLISQADGTRARTLAVLVNGEMAPNYEFALDDPAAAPGDSGFDLPLTDSDGTVRGHVRAWRKDATPLSTEAKLLCEGPRGPRGGRAAVVAGERAAARPQLRASARDPVGPQLRHHRGRKPRADPGDGERTARRVDRRHGADLRRNRHGQGTDRADDPLAERARRGTVHQARVRDAVRGSRRRRDLGPRPRRRDHLPRRGRRSRTRGAGADAAGPACAGAARAVRRRSPRSA